MTALPAANERPALAGAPPAPEGARVIPVLFGSAPPAPDGPPPVGGDDRGAGAEPEPEPDPGAGDDVPF